jgi:hypothetical protein
VTDSAVTSALGRPYDSTDWVEVADLLWSAACKAPQRQQRQQQQQKQQKCPKCVCESREEDNQSGFDYEGTTFGLVGLLIIKSGLGAILMFLPKARSCIFAVLALGRSIRIASQNPESRREAPQAVVEATVQAPV